MFSMFSTQTNICQCFQHTKMSFNPRTQGSKIKLNIKKWALHQRQNWIFSLMCSTQKLMLSPMCSKHRNNCECGPRHSLFKGHNVIVNIVVFNCQKCNQCIKCQVSGHKSPGSENFQKSAQRELEPDI